MLYVYIYILHNYTLFRCVIAVNLFRVEYSVGSIHFSSISSDYHNAHKVRCA